MRNTELISHHQLEEFKKGQKVSQTWILVRVAISFARRSSPPRD